MLVGVEASAGSLRRSPMSLINKPGPRAVVVTAVAGLFIASGIVVHDEAGATPASSVQQANPTITITSEGTYFTYSPTQLDTRVGQAITVTNNDPLGAHSVVEKNRSFSVDVPPNSSATLTVSKAGNYQYFCDWHADAHEPRYGSLNVS
jgi:plastocyanin